MNGVLVHNSHVVLIITDDAAFARDLLARWQLERIVPGFTVMSTELFNGAATGRFDLAVIGPVRSGRLDSILKSLDTVPHPVICVLETSQQAQGVKAEWPRLLALRQHEGWIDSLLLLANECLKRVDLTLRVRKAEQAVTLNAHNAALGHYMLENRHSISNLLTSVLGNAELLMMDSDGFSEMARDQIQTIHDMALHMHEIMQRFSSIAVEMQVAEKSSQDETGRMSHLFAPSPS